MIFKPAARGKGPILLVERAGNPLKGFWSLPGGLVENGETLAEAVVREVREETGLEVRATALFGLFERIIVDDRQCAKAGSTQGHAEYHYLLADYICEVTGGEIQAGDDVSRVEWVRRSELGKFKLTDGTRDVIEQAYRKSRSAPVECATILSVTGVTVGNDVKGKKQTGPRKTVKRSKKRV